MPSCLLADVLLRWLTRVHVYDRKWGKKVVFLVNKVDILSRHEEVAEVADFVAANAQRLLGVEAAKVLPISARAALDAKLAHSNGSNGTRT